MSYLITRAEQALLGAILRDSQNTLHAVRDALEAEDFGHRAHQQLWRALTALDDTRPGLHGDRLMDAVAERITAPGADRAWLDQLRARAADGRHVGSYVRMVQTAAMRRDVAAIAEHMALNPDQARLASALHRQVMAQAQLTADTATPADTADPADAAEAMAQLRPADAVTAAPPVTRHEAGHVADPRLAELGDAHQAARAAAEDRLLADLLRHPEQALDLARGFPAETLTDPQRREVFRSMLTLAVDGDPIDEVILAVRIEEQRAMATYLPRVMARAAQVEPPIEPIDPGAEPIAAYLDRLSHLDLDVAHGGPTAVQIGQQLLSDDIRAQLQHGPTGHPHPALAWRDVGQARPPGPAAPGHAATADWHAGGATSLPLGAGQHRPLPPAGPGPTPRTHP